MAVPRTSLHTGRIISQISTNLIQLQADINRNARAHKTMAQAQSPSLEVLNGFISDCVIQYEKRLKWVEDVLDAPAKKQLLSNGLTKMQWNESDISDIVTPLKTAVQNLQLSAKTGYPEIITACDVVLAEVNMPESLWPE